VPVLLLLGALIAQNPPLAADEAGLERIRKALSEQPAITTTSTSGADGRTVFKMAIENRQLRSIWSDTFPVPSYIRPFWRGYHHEFLEMVTPEEFRSATLYPVGIPVDRLIEKLAKEISAAHRRALERGAREEVTQALAELFACRANPAGPGC
jgi:hypothetical protein